MSKAQENVGTVRQPLVGGKIIDEAWQEELGLLSYSDGSRACSASLLRNAWVITPAHCVDAKDTDGNFIPDPVRPGQNMLKPIASMTLTTNWKAAQSETAVRVETFRPYDMA
ncbi:MAG TPA: trypsin-like serine protease [Leptolyngbyaceae cyanobacterium]